MAAAQTQDSWSAMDVTRTPSWVNIAQALFDPQTMMYSQSLWVWAYTTLNGSKPMERSFITCHINHEHERRWSLAAQWENKFMILLLKALLVFHVNRRTREFDPNQRHITCHWSLQGHDPKRDPTQGKVTLQVAQSVRTQFQTIEIRRKNRTWWIWEQFEFALMYFVFSLCSELWQVHFQDPMLNEVHQGSKHMHLSLQELYACQRFFSQEPRIQSRSQHNLLIVEIVG